MDQTPSQTNDPHYLQHLTELNQDQAVVASEDIFNQFGVLLIPKGGRINPKAQQRLQQHALEKSIDQQVALEHTLSDKQIFNQTLEMLELNQELQQLHQRNRFEDPFRHICLTGSLALPLRQKLSVMQRQFPELFEHSLFNGWASALIAKEMKLPPAACREAYLCGLLHDIGLLHVSPEVQTQSPLSEENWRALQSHVVIGQRCVEQCGLSQQIGRGILEHHERLDRTGYPSRKPPEKLALLGQIIASADLLHNLFTNELGQGSIHDAMPYFKVHHGSFHQQIHSALMRILSRLDPVSEQGDISDLNLTRVRQVNQQLQRLLAPLGELLQKLHAAQVKNSHLTNMITSINALLNNSGIGDPQLGHWLQSELNLEDQDDYRCLKETDAMQYELLWLVKRLGWNLENQLQSSHQFSPEARKALEAYQQHLQQALEEAFSLYRTPSEDGKPADTGASPA